ncbi:MAG: B12-binding domain-containing radical SAM protein [Syntrophaceae bacterium]|nr:B12-binding domain-containing radical SAM protein [Syntrophaceae bacterium]
MNILLVKPPERSRFNFGTFSLAVLAAYVRDLAKISIFDATHHTVDRASSVMLSKKYDLIGITVMSPSSVKSACALIRSARRMFKQNGRPLPRLVCGGHGASMYPYPLLAAGADSVVFGQGEQPFRAMLQNTMDDVPGTIRLDKKNLVRIPAAAVVPPGQLPLPARDLISIPSDGIHLMETSRGCPHRCSFCETSQFYAHTWKAFPSARVSSEVQHLVELQNAWMILIADDNFAASAARILEICPRLEKGPLPLFFLASARIDDLSADSRILPALAAARIARISVGIETVDEECGKKIGKGYSLALCRDTILSMRRLGMYTVASFIVGLPGETDHLKEMMLEAAVDIGADSVTFVPLHPLPQGTERTCAEIRLPRLTDEKNAQKMTLAFHSHPQVIARRKEALQEDSLRGIITRASMNVQ